MKGFSAHFASFFALLRLSGVERQSSQLGALDGEEFFAIEGSPCQLDLVTWTYTHSEILRVIPKRAHSFFCFARWTQAGSPGLELPSVAGSDDCAAWLAA